jgi:hypothetical protein
MLQGRSPGLPQLPQQQQQQQTNNNSIIQQSPYQNNSRFSTNSNLLRSPNTTNSTQLRHDVN